MTVTSHVAAGPRADSPIHHMGLPVRLPGQSDAATPAIKDPVSARAPEEVSACEKQYPVQFRSVSLSRNNVVTQNFERRTKT